MNLSVDREQKKQAGRWLAGQGRHVRKWVMTTVCLGVLSGLLLVVQMYCIAHVAWAVFMDGQHRSEVGIYFIVMLVVVLLRAVLAWLKERSGIEASAQVRQQVREQLYTHICRLGPVGAAQKKAGELVSTALEQVEGLDQYFAKYLPQMSVAVFLPLAMLVAIFPVSVVSGLLLLFCAPLIPLFMALVGMGASSLHQKHFNEISRMSQAFLDTLLGLVTLKSLGSSQRHARSVFEAAERYRKRTMSVLRIAFLSSAVLELFAAVSIAILAVYLGLGFINAGTGNDMWWSLEGMTLQGALFILLVAPEFFLPLRELGTHYHARAQAIGAAMEIQKVMALEADETVADKPAEMPHAHATLPLQVPLGLQHLSLYYEQHARAALADFSLDIAAGEKVALVGPSGSGKTSLLNLVLGFITPSSGKVLVDGLDIARLPEQERMAYVSWLGQNPVLFPGTLRENLQLADPDADDPRLWLALKQAGLAETVAALPNQLNTRVGEKNAGLSGGQAQRVALARVWLKQAPLWLLDEPTASVDAEQARQLEQALTTLWGDKTVVMATHRMETLAAMDRIIVLDAGRIVQVGSFDELLADRDGTFHAIYYMEAEAL